MNRCNPSSRPARRLTTQAFCLISFLALGSAQALAQVPNPPPVPFPPAEGEQPLYTPEPKRILGNKPFDDSPEARQAIIDAFQGLRVTDISDGMDALGLQDVGVMDRSIRPLWRDVESMSHAFVGFAVTVRYVPVQFRLGRNSFVTPGEWEEKVRGPQYGQSSERHWRDLGRKGDAVVVFDADDVGYTGYIGSMNSLSWAAAGFVGVVTDGNARDTDEIILSKGIPVYTKTIGGGIRPARVWLDTVNAPVVCGGALVFPGDVIVADGDGVLVVPREHALAVAEYTRPHHDTDQDRRLELYEELGLPLDRSIEGAARRRDSSE
jgi:regulator of RNase E activity RraA